MTGSLRLRTRLALVLAFALAASVAMAMPPVVQPVQAAAFTVGPDAGDDFDNLVDAVNAANALTDFDTISVAPGTYTGSLFIAEDLTITAEQPGSVVVDGGGLDRVIRIGDGVTAVPAVTLEGLEITGGSSGFDGGGILVEASSSLTLVDSWVHGNLGWDGGGLAVDGAIVSVLRSTFSDNTADDGEGGNGGAIAVENLGLLSLYDSTVSGNNAFSSGGGVYVEPGAAADIRNATIVENFATFGGGIGSFGATVARNTIIANNSAEVDVDCEGTLSSAGHNLIGIGTTGCTILNADDMLYWVDNDLGRIESANLNGSSRSVVATGKTFARGVAVNRESGEDRLYYSWVNGGLGGTDTISKIDADGTNDTTLIDSALAGPALMAIDDSGVTTAQTKLYYVDGPNIERSNLDGSSIEVVVTANDPEGIALDEAAGKIYYVDTGVDEIRRANLDLSGVPEAVLDVGAAGFGTWPVGIGLDLVRGKLYWSDAVAQTINRADLDGANAETVADIVTDNPADIAINPFSDTLYFTDRTDARIYKIPLGVSSATPSTVVSGLVDPLGIDVSVSPTVNDIVGTFAAPADPQLGPLALNGGSTPTHLPLDGSPVIDSGDNAGVSTFDQTGIVSRTFGGTTDRGARERGGVTVCSVGCDYTTLNAALDAATNGEFILVGGETFTETVTVDTNVVIQGEGMDITVIDGNSSGRVIDVASDSSAVIRDLSITGGVTDVGADGAGVRAIGSGSVVTLEGVHIWGNDSAGSGGGVYTTQQVSIIDSYIDSNTASSGGGGVASSTPAAVVDVIRTTVASNSAGVRGGGLQAADGTWNVLNSTITANDAPAGSGIWNDDGTFTLNNTTVWDNIPVEQIWTGGGATRTANSIIGSPNAWPDCQGPLQLFGYNFITEDTDCLFDFANSPGGEQIGDAFKLDPDLAPFGLYDGPVPVLPLNDGSDAVDAGNPGFDVGFPNCEAFDQQGFDRGFDYPCDIGAVEGAIVPFGTIQGAVDGAFPGDTINVPPGLYVESVIIDKDLTLNGFGVTISNLLANQPTLTVFGPSVVELNGFSLTDGEGGGLNVFDASASVTLNDVLVDSNANFLTGNGGGVINAGTLVMNSGSISFNTATSPFDGGGLYNTGTATLNGVVVEGNTVGNPGDGSRGGGIFNSGTLTVTGGSVIGGAATPGSGHTADNGGGIYNTGTLTVSNAAVSNNDADDLNGTGAGGGIYTTDGATITGTTVDGNTAIAGGGVYNEGDLTVNGGTVFRNNFADSQEGGGVGGGIYSAFGIVDIDNAAFVDNVAFSQGGALYSFADGAVIDNTSFDSNFGRLGGGAIYLRDAFSSTITNSTFDKNHTGDFGEGGAILADDFHSLTVNAGAFRNNGAG
ncbi:MAG: choice-of-anchor Q domain-containing protein, partial [Acidimicrobiia bacterium]|nr:choice-of-anchor Q domain-containing protein [Acidimicrobiia bacterium]